MVSNYTKKRLLLILELLYKTTDEENPISTVGIMEYLKDKGFSNERKALTSDMRILTDMDYDILTRKNTLNKYLWGSRDFELPESKLLIDAVSSSRFNTKKKSEDLA